MTMTPNVELQGGEPQEKPKLGFRGTLAYWLAAWEAGVFKRDRRRSKGQQPPTKGITGPINHDEDGHPWLWMEVETVPGFQTMTRSRQKHMKYNFTKVLESLEGRELDIQVQALPFGSDEVEAKMKAGIIGRPSAEVAERHAKSRERNQENLKKRGFKQRRCYIGVKMSDKRNILMRLVSELMLRMGFGSLLAIGYEHIIYHSQIQEILDKFRHNNLPVRPLSGVETAQVIQRCVYRGHGKLPELKDNSGVIRDSGELKRLTSSAGLIPRDNLDMIQIFQDGESRYASYLAVASLPDKDFDISWLFVGDNKNRPVEASVRISIKDRARAKSYNQHTILRIRNEIANLVKAGGEANREEINKQEARERMAEAVNHRYEQGDTSAEVNAFLVVSDDNAERLKKNRSYVIEQCRRRKILLEVDETYLVEIRRQTYPGARLTYTDYQLNLFLDGVADAMPHGTSHFGDRGDLQGEVVGRDGGPFIYAHRLVVFDKEIDGAPGQVVIGPSGEGKTTDMVNDAIADALANLGALHDAGKDDALILKGEHDLLVDIVSMDLSDPEMAGLLNPFYLGDDIQEKQDLTVQMCWKWIRAEGQPIWQSVLSEAIAEELDEHPDDPDMKRLIMDRLYNADRSDPDGATRRAIGLALRSMLLAKHAEVLTTKGRAWKDVADTYIRRGQVTFVVYGNLTPPTEDKPVSDLTPQERLAYLVRDMTNVIYYKFAMDTSIPVAIYKDEIQIDNRMGGSVASGHLSRVGRSKGSTITLGGQLISDVPKDFWENTSTIKFYRFKNVSTAKEAIDLLGIDVEPGSAEETQWIALLRGTDGSGRKPYDVLIKTYDGQLGMVARKQIYDGGRFVSNVQAVEERRRERQAALAAASRLPHIGRMPTPEATELALMQLGVSPDVFGSTNGYHEALEEWVEIVLNLQDDERVAVVDGKLAIIKVTEHTSQQLPLASPVEAKPE
jgi:hypothetical protein